MIRALIALVFSVCLTLTPAYRYRPPATAGAPAAHPRPRPGPHGRPIHRPPTTTTTKPPSTTTSTWAPAGDTYARCDYAPAPDYCWSMPGYTGPTR